MEEKRRLIWDKHALAKLKESLKWISKTSLQQAENVEEAILATIDIIRSHPERYPSDKYKRKNSGGKRAFETHGYRISYDYTEREVRILRVRHVRQSHKVY